jgi:hypothetical protein
MIAFNFFFMVSYGSGLFSKLGFLALGIRATFLLSLLKVAFFRSRLSLT